MLVLNITRDEHNIVFHVQTEDEVQQIRIHIKSHIIAGEELWVLHQDATIIRWQQEVDPKWRHIMYLGHYFLRGYSSEFPIDLETDFSFP
jgi:hypothetical protein